MPLIQCSLIPICYLVFQIYHLSNTSFPTGQLIIANMSLVQYFFSHPMTYRFKYTSYPTVVVSHQLLVISNRKLLKGKKIPSQWDASQQPINIRRLCLTWWCRRVPVWSVYGLSILYGVVVLFPLRLPFAVLGWNSRRMASAIAGQGREYRVLDIVELLRGLWEHITRLNNAFDEYLPIFSIFKLISKWTALFHWFKKTDRRRSIIPHYPLVI